MHDLTEESVLSLLVCGCAPAAAASISRSFRRLHLFAYHRAFILNAGLENPKNRSQCHLNGKVFLLHMVSVAKNKSPQKPNLTFGRVWKVCRLRDDWKKYNNPPTRTRIGLAPYNLETTHPTDTEHLGSPLLPSRLGVPRE